MLAGDKVEAAKRQRLLIVAHSFDANYSMESKLSWLRATQSAIDFDTTIICAEPYGSVRSDIDAVIPGLDVVAIPHTSTEKKMIDTTTGFYAAYRLWHRRVYRVAKQLHEANPFALVHQVSYCGYREPGYCWQLDAPFIWGPIGGTQNVPWRFLSQLDLWGALKEAKRSIANKMQLRLSRRVRRAIEAAHVVFAANQEVRDCFQDVHKVTLPCQLETGIDCITTKTRTQRSKKTPLHILWVGRLECWKGLPLLLRAISQLDNSIPVKLRIVGSGTREQKYKRLANRLGLENCIEWIPLPELNDRTFHYHWADVFAFTSLRDTSGTGLLESLAAGVPIIGLDHQGARDIMNAHCAIPIPVHSPSQVIAALRIAIIRLANDSDYLCQLSHGATNRAESFHWDKLNARMTDAYNKALANAKCRPISPHHANEELVVQSA